MPESADPRLSAWLRDVDLAPGADRQAAIGAAATSLAEDLDRAEILELVTLAHGVNPSAMASRVLEAVHEQDSTAALRAGDQETRLTAAITAIYGIEADPDLGVALGLAVRSAGFVGLAPALAELPAIATRGLIAHSEALRARTPLSTSAPDIKSVITEAGDYSDDSVQVWSQDIRAALTATEKSALRAAAVATRLATALNRRLAATDEELDVLWWCFGGFSELSDRPVSRIPAKAAAVVLGVELASRTTQLAPLPSMRALLSRLLGTRSDSRITLGAAVPAALKLVDDALPDVDGHRLMPVLSAARECRQLSGRPAWKESLSRWKIDADRETTNLELAQQVAQEVLLARAME